MKKIFISQPMNGLSDEEIKEKRKEVVDKLPDFMMGEEFEIIDSFFEKAPHDAKPLWFLGKSLELLADADYAIFLDGWSAARGCRMENMCCQEYVIQTIYEKNLTRENGPETTRSSRDNDGWIPVDDRLPIPNKEVWVTVKRNGNVFTSTDEMTENGHFLNFEKGNILAWKEKEAIPEPYRPERSNDEKK